MKYSIFLLTFIVSACSSTKLVQDWKNPDVPVFEANKVLVVGMTGNTDMRRLFETEMINEMEKHNMVAVRSSDFFESSFTNNQQTETDLDKLEQQLLVAGFDAILITGVSGYHNKVTLVQAYRNLAKPYQSFRDFYYQNQYIYQKEMMESYKVYSAQTSLFCICPDKERELIWKGDFEFIEKNNPVTIIKEYSTKLTETLEEKSLLIIK